MKRLYLCAESCSSDKYVIFKYSRGRYVGLLWFSESLFRRKWNAPRKCKIIFPFFFFRLLPLLLLFSALFSLEYSSCLFIRHVENFHSKEIIFFFFICSGSFSIQNEIPSWRVWFHSNRNNNNNTTEEAHLNIDIKFKLALVKVS